jgi:hypothetical protein
MGVFKMKVCTNCHTKTRDENQLCEYCGFVFNQNETKIQYKRMNYLKVFNYNEIETHFFDNSILEHLTTKFGIGNESFGLKNDIIDENLGYFMSGEIRDVIEELKSLAIIHNINIATILEYNVYDTISSKKENIDEDDAIFCLNYYLVIDNHGIVHVNQSSNFGIGHNEFIGFYRFDHFINTFFTPQHILIYDPSNLSAEIIEYLESEDKEYDDDLEELIQEAAGELSYEIADETNDEDYIKFKEITEFSELKKFSVNFI